MSELDKTKEELIEILDKIPSSDSFGAAELARQVTQLTEKMIALNSLPSAHVDEDAMTSAETKKG